MKKKLKHGRKQAKSLGGGLKVQNDRIRKFDKEKPREIASKGS